MSVLKKDLIRTYSITSGNKLKRLINTFRKPGVRAMITIRFGQWVARRNILLRLLLTPIYFFMNHRVRTRWGIEIPRATQIGSGFYIGHFGGIIISDEAIIGKNCSISQGVTIGVSGQGDKYGCPVIGDNTYIAPGAKVFGKIKVGKNVKIGANAVIHKDIPDNAIVVLDPGFKILSYKGNYPDLVNAPDHSPN
jgi:serine O-acetyltransferase